MKISVVTVCFNSEKTIERTIQSFIQQDYSNKELILIDGGSTDQTRQIVERYRGHIAHLVSEPDAGIYDAMNKGWKLASGDFVHFLNSDDWYASPHALSDAVSFMSNSKTLYYGKINYHHQSGFQNHIGHPSSVDELRYELKGIYQPATFFPRAAFQDLGGFDLRYRIAADYDLIRRFVQKCPQQFIEMVVTNMSDSGASAKNIKTALRENSQIALRFGESRLLIYTRSLWVRFWLFVRYKYPSIFRTLKMFKDKLS